MAIKIRDAINISEPTKEGPQGAQGSQGPQGNPGPQGTASTFPGPQGPQGNPGPQGEIGIGIPGLPGDEGPQGPQGIQGFQGSQGAASIIPGPQGSQGAAGAQGSQGAAGADSTVPGPQGAAGAEGPQGPQGAAGASANQTLDTTSNVRFNSIGVGTNASGTTGEIRATNNITAYFSDKRLKNILGPIDQAIEKIDKIEGIYYTQNKFAENFGYNDYSRQVGVIAQDVQSVLPEIVKIAPFDLNENNESASGENYLTIQYEKLVPLLIQCIKEINIRLEKLEKLHGTS